MRQRRDAWTFLCPVSVCFIDNQRCLPSVVCGSKMTRISVCVFYRQWTVFAIRCCGSKMTPWIPVFYRRFPGCSFTRSCTWNFQISITLISRILPVPLRTASNDDRFSCILAGDLIDRGAVRRQTSCIYIYIYHRHCQEIWALINVCILLLEVYIKTRYII